MIKYFVLSILLISGTNIAGEADIIDVTIQAVGSNSFRINATLQHVDTGWDHYADAWDVLDENNQVLGTRVLHHPHVDEQPFTRSLTLSIPNSVKMVTIRARDSEHQYGGKTYTVTVPY